MLGASSGLRTSCNLGCGDRLQAGQSGWGPAVEHWQLATLTMECAGLGDGWGEEGTQGGVGVDGVGGIFLENFEPF